jgi:hypothetical protein
MNSAISVDEGGQLEDERLANHVEVRPRGVGPAALYEREVSLRIVSAWSRQSSASTG